MFVKPESWLYIKYKCSPDSEFIAFVGQNDQTVVSNAVFFIFHSFDYIHRKQGIKLNKNNLKNSSKCFSNMVNYGKYPANCSFMNLAT